MPFFTGAMLFFTKEHGTFYILLFALSQQREDNFFLGGKILMKNIFILVSLIYSLSSEAKEFIVQVENIKDFSEVRGFSPLRTKNIPLLKYSGTLEELQSVTANKKILRIEENISLQLLKTNDSQDPLFNKQWHLENTGLNSRTTVIVPGVKGEDIDAKKAWDVTTGSDAIKIALIDTGVDYNNPDLQDNIWQNQQEKNGLPGIDDDGNGYVDDIFGYDFINQDNDPIDEDGHGSHCAGIIGAVHGNGGIKGVMGQVKIMSLKFSTGGAGTMDAALEAIDYAIEHGADIMSNSWGGAPAESILFDLLKIASEKGIFIVNAAGNSGNNSDRFPIYPASYDIPGNMSVGATMGRGSKATFSNYGKTMVDVFAPGQNIYSTWFNGKYRRKSGTSMAAPIVAGIAGLALSIYPELTPTEVKDFIIKSSESLSALKGMAVGGRVNANNLVNEILKL